MYAFLMALFDNGYPEELLLFVQNFKMTIDASGTLIANAKLHYLCTQLHVEALHQSYTLCDQVGSTNMSHLNQFILGLGTYYFPVNALSEQMSVIRRGMRNLRKLKVL